MRSQLPSMYYPIFFLSYRACYLGVLLSSAGKHFHFAYTDLFIVLPILYWVLCYLLFISRCSLFIFDTNPDRILFPCLWLVLYIRLWLFVCKEFLIFSAVKFNNHFPSHLSFFISSLRFLPTPHQTRLWKTLSCFFFFSSKCSKVFVFYKQNFFGIYFCF